MEQEYLVLIQIGGGGDKEIYRPGSRIMLDDARAAAHLVAGNVLAINATVEPKAPASDVVVHEALALSHVEGETAASRRAAGPWLGPAPARVAHLPVPG